MIHIHYQILLKQFVNQFFDYVNLEFLDLIDPLMRINIKNNKSPNPALIPNEFGINSNYRFDWSDQVDFGSKDKRRFYTNWTGALYFRVFRLNPKNKRDQHGAQASFRLEKDLKEIFVNALNKDIEENINK